MIKTQTRGKALSWQAACIIGSTTGFLMLLITLIITSIMIFYGYIGMEYIPVLGVAIQFITVFIGTLTGSLISHNSIMKICACIMAAIYIVSLAIAILFFNGISSHAIWGLLSSIIGAVGTILLRVSFNPHHRKRNKNKRYR